MCEYRETEDANNEIDNNLIKFNMNKYLYDNVTDENIIYITLQNTCLCHNKFEENSNLLNPQINIKYRDYFNKKIVFKIFKKDKDFIRYIDIYDEINYQYVKQLNNIIDTYNLDVTCDEVLCKHRKIENIEKENNISYKVWFSD